MEVEPVEFIEEEELLAETAAELQSDIDRTDLHDPLKPTESQRDPEEEMQAAAFDAGLEELKQHFGSEQFTDGDAWEVQYRQNKDGSFSMDWGEGFKDIEGDLDTAALINELKGGYKLHYGQSENGGTVEVIVDQEETTEGTVYRVATQEFVFEEAKIEALAETEESEEASYPPEQLVQELFPVELVRENQEVSSSWWYRAEVQRQEIGLFASLTDAKATGIEAFTTFFPIEVAVATPRGIEMQTTTSIFDALSSAEPGTTVILPAINTAERLENSPGQEQGLLMAREPTAEVMVVTQQGEQGVTVEYVSRPENAPSPEGPLGKAEPVVSDLQRVPMQLHEPSIVHVALLPVPYRPPLPTDGMQHEEILSNNLNPTPPLLPGMEGRILNAEINVEEPIASVEPQVPPVPSEATEFSPILVSPDQPEAKTNFIPILRESSKTPFIPLVRGKDRESSPDKGREGGVLGPFLSTLPIGPELSVVSDALAPLESAPLLESTLGDEPVPLKAPPFMDLPKAVIGEPVVTAQPEAGMGRIIDVALTIDPSAERRKVREVLSIIKEDTDNGAPEVLILPQVRSSNGWFSRVATDGLPAAVGSAAARQTDDAQALAA